MSDHACPTTELHTRPGDAAVRWLGKAVTLTGKLDWLHPTLARREGREFRSSNLALHFWRLAQTKKPLDTARPPR